MSHYEKAWQEVMARIAHAASSAGRDPNSVRLLAVSKTFPPEAIRAVHALGQRAFGENYVQECAEKIPFYRERWLVKPGATGWAQINRGYNATLEDNREKLAYDLFYIKNASLGLDLLIMFQTIKTVLLGRGAQ